MLRNLSITASILVTFALGVLLAMGGVYGLVLPITALYRFDLLVFLLALFVGVISWMIFLGILYYPWRVMRFATPGARAVLIILILLAGWFFAYYNPDLSARIASGFVLFLVGGLSLK